MPPRLSFIDRYLPDGRVERQYSNGTTEWRFMQAPDRIAWNDNRGQQGVDILLGNGQVQRHFANGRKDIGQNLGNGVTSWNNGQYITVNETVFPDQMPPAPRAAGGMSGLFVGLGLGWMFGLSANPGSPYDLDPASSEYALYAEYDMWEAEQLRRQQQQTTSDSGSSGDGGYDSSDSGWSDSSSGAGGDFGSDSFG
jgi:hypothetical protein